MNFNAAALSAWVRFIVLALLDLNTSFSRSFAQI